MKIALGNGGSYLEPDEGPRDTKFHKRIVRVEPIPGTRAGNDLTLECGHGVQAHGRGRSAAALLRAAGGRLAGSRRARW